MTDPRDPMPTIRETLSAPGFERLKSLDFAATLAGLPPAEPAPVIGIAPPARRHAEDATQLLDTLHEWQAEEGETDTSMLTVVLEAQVEATLALVAQQRIANLIAWQALTGEGNRVAIRRELEP